MNNSFWPSMGKNLFAILKILNRRVCFEKAERLLIQNILKTTQIITIYIITNYICLFISGMLTVN